MHMKITGYQLREAIKQQSLKRDTIAASFTGTLKKFPEETKDAPKDVMQEFLLAELAVTQLQMAQMRYNLVVQVEVLGESMTLGEAIKRVGGSARAEKMWRTAANPKRDHYYGGDEERDPTKVRPVAALTAKELLRLAQGAAKQAGAFRAAIATGNAVVIDIEGLTSALFE
jgi:hypothetical protein